MCGVTASVVVRGRCLQDFCKRQNGRNGLCRNAAKAAEIRLAFAGTLQTSREYGWPLQECCKRHGNTVGLCRNAASATGIRLAFAGTLQASRKYGWHLQECCKCHGDTVGICRNAASVTGNEDMIGYLLLEVSFAGAIKIKDENHII